MRHAKTTFRLLLAVVAVLPALQAAPAQAASLPPVGPCAVSLTSQPRLAYVSDPADSHTTAWAAQPDGSQPVRIGTGASTATISRDGSTVALVSQRSGSSTLAVVPSNGGSSKTLLHTRGSIDQVTWSETGWLAVVVSGHQLVIFDPTQRVQRTIARAGAIDGVSFMPGCSDRLVYGRANTGLERARVDLYAATVDGAHTQRLTHDGHSLYPQWGPLKIAYSRKKLRRNDLSAYQLWTIGADGRAAHQLTHMHVGEYLWGLTATAWSADGKRLLAEFTGTDTDEAWTVQVPSGRARDLTGKIDHVSGMGLSIDGSTVLVERGSPEDATQAMVATIPFGGGPAHTIVAHGGAPTWNR
jgi:Tol biopolymer transport system component